jgi:hypothetical protein
VLILRRQLPVEHFTEEVLTAQDARLQATVHPGFARTA